MKREGMLTNVLLRKEQRVCVGDIRRVEENKGKRTHDEIMD